MRENSALKAVSPQAPVTDYYLGDDSFHNGAFMLAANFGFYTNFPVRPAPARPEARPPFEYGTPSGYEFYLQMGPLYPGAARLGLAENPYYRANLEHTAYDDFWKARAIWTHFTNITPAVLSVGGWFDAEDIAGPRISELPPKYMKSGATPQLWKARARNASRPVAPSRW